MGGIYISRIACAVSNMTDANSKNVKTLREALLGGINTISIPCNLENPSPANLTHKVIYELIKAGRILRNNLVIISSLGYSTQYNNQYKMYKLKTNLYYSLDIKYLELQLNDLLESLSMNTIDVLLINQPEVLFDYHREYNTEELFNQEYDLATSWLNNLVQENKIQFAGICSTAISKSNDLDHGLTLEKVLSFPNQPKVIQTPTNLLESDFRFNRNIKGGLLSSQLISKKIMSIGYRPFQAIYNGKIVHLAGQTNPALDGGASTAAELNKHLTRLVAQEKQIIELFSDRHFQFDERLPAPSAYLQQYKDHFLEILSFKNSLNDIKKHLQKTFNFIKIHTRSDIERYTLESLENLTNTFLLLWKDYINATYQLRIGHYQKYIEKTDIAYDNKALSLQGLLYLLSLDVPNTILISIKYPNQIKQIFSVFGSDLPDPANNLSTISSLEEAMESFNPRMSII